MTNQDIIEKLRSLTRQQKIVLKGVCEGKPYKQIAEELFLSIDTIKTHMGNVYLKLGLKDLPPTLRRVTIIEEYWPVFKKFDFDESIIHQNEPEDTEEPELVPDEVIDMVDKDEMGLIVFEPKVIIIPEKEKKEKRKKKRHIWRWILFIILIALLVFGGIQVYSWASYFLNNVVAPMVAQDTPEVIPTQGYVQYTPLPTSETTEKASVPNNTEVPPTPISTRTPAPKISLPFNDDFSQGFNSVWDLQFADWIITNGKASIIQTENLDTGWAIINDPTLNNYRLKVHIDTPHMYSAAQGETYILVRYDQNRDKQLLLSLDRLENVFWGMTRGLQNTIDPITDATKYEFPASANVVIEANGSNFTAWVAGQMVGSISISGFDRGGVALGIFCTYSDCPTISDFSLESIN